MKGQLDRQAVRPAAAMLAANVPRGKRHFATQIVLASSLLVSRIVGRPVGIRGGRSLAASSPCLDLFQALGGFGFLVVLIEWIAPGRQSIPGRSGAIAEGPADAGAVNRPAREDIAE